MEQLEIMSGAVWQHTGTLLSVLAFAVTGEEGAERARTATGSAGRSRGRDYSAEWEAAGLRWNLASPPRVSPEQDRARKEKALSQLLGVQAAAREAGVAAPPKQPRRRQLSAPKGGPLPASDVDAELDRMVAQLREAEARDEGA